MPGSLWDEPGLRHAPPPAVAVVVPVAISLLVQVPAAYFLALWATGPRAVLPAVAVAAASALALAGARRWPGPTVAVVTAITALDMFVPPAGAPPFVALAFAIVAAVVRDARVWAWVSVGTGWLVVLIGGSMRGLDWHPVRVALATLALVVCFGIGGALRARLRFAAERRAQFAERRRAAEQDERNRIARELHDVLAHSLSQISVQSGVGLHLFDREPEKAREALANIRTLSATGLDEVRGVLSFLRGDEAGAPSTAPLTPLPQLAQLPALVAGRSALGLTVALDDELGGELPASAIQTSAYRIVQEALTNVVRHSAASHATVTLAREDDGGDDLVVTVADDGIGMPDAPAERGGVRGMRERAELVGGTLEIAPAPRTGTVVRARLPWEAPA